MLPASQKLPQLSSSCRDDLASQLALLVAVNLCQQPAIEKNRYRIPLGAVVWEVDEFLGANLGLVVAEIELASEDQAFDKPKWIGREVTGDPKYFNANLVARPFSAW